jgi:hypothetical protein
MEKPEGRRGGTNYLAHVRRRGRGGAAFESRLLFSQGVTYAAATLFDRLQLRLQLEASSPASRMRTVDVTHSLARFMAEHGEGAVGKACESGRAGLQRSGFPKGHDQ